MDDFTQAHEPRHQLVRMMSVEMIMGHTYPLSIGSCCMDFKDGLWGGIKHSSFVLEETDVMMLMRLRYSGLGAGARVCIRDQFWWHLLGASARCLFSPRNHVHNSVPEPRVHSP